MTDWRGNTAHWRDLETKPFDLGRVPAELQWCIYPEELARGEVLLPETIYLIVLVLRWILTYTSPGLEEDYETWKVYWKSNDWYGFKTDIILCREKVEQYEGSTDEFMVLQPQTWYTLASLGCGNGRGVVTEVATRLPAPYYDGNIVRLSGTSGVQRLLEDASRASSTTGGVWGYGVQIDKNGTYTLRRTDTTMRYETVDMNFELVGYGEVRSLSLKFSRL